MELTLLLTPMYSFTCMKIKLPDAIIAATAIHYNLPLLSADKGFKNISGLTLITL